MIKTVMLVRHGQTKSNVTNYFSGRSEEDLDEVGYAQAHCLSSRLSSLSLDGIYASPLKRTLTTAKILAEPHGLKVDVLEDLIELGIGDLSGHYVDQIVSKWPELWQEYLTDPTDVTFPNGESFRQVIERAIRVFNTLTSNENHKLIVVVSHEAIIKVLVAHILGVSNNIYRRFTITNASLTEIKFAKDACRIVSLNDTSHIKV